MISLKKMEAIVTLEIEFTSLIEFIVGVQMYLGTFLLNYQTQYY